VKIPTATVAEVVAEASKKMADPNYSAVMVGGFVQGQTATAQYLGAHEDEVGGTEQVVNAIFHAALIALCFQRAHNRTIREMTFEDLDHVAGDDTTERLKVMQPAIHEYIEANVETEQIKRVLRLVALAMDWVS
jgi:hypothetical protein